MNTIDLRMKIQFKYFFCFLLFLFSCAVFAQSIDKKLLKAAKKGDASSQFTVGEIYDNAQNYKEAFLWYKKAADQGDATSQYKLGYLYANGYGVSQDYSIAYDWYKKAANQGVVLAQKSLGILYANGYGVPQDYNEAYKWGKKAADQGNATAQNNLGFLYANGLGVPQDYSKAYEWYKKAAEQGNATAQANLGYMYNYGNGVPLDYEEARKWFKMAADQGDADAQNNLGFLYKNGYVGEPFDYKEACKWYKMAADQGHALAQNNLGYMYNYGYGVPLDYEEARKWYKKAADQNLDMAQNNLGIIYNNAKDYSEALKWFIKAADQGYAKSQYYVGLYYFKGYGVQQDYTKAYDWFEKAAVQGYAEAQSYIGFIYDNKDYGKRQDYSEAFKWYKLAAEQGNSTAQYNLGLLYYNGKGRAKDDLEAYKWFKEAADQNHERAKAKLIELEKIIGKNTIETLKIPVLTWLSFESITKEKNYSFKIGVKSGSKVEDVSVYVNGNLTRGIMPVANDGFNLTIDRTIALNDGQNTIKVTVKNASGTASTEKTITYQNQSVATIDWLAFTPTTNEKQFALKAGIKSLSKIESWSVTVNGVIERGVNPVMNDNYSMMIDKPLTLAEGNNIIKIEVKNAGGVAMTEKKVTYIAEKATLDIHQRRIALVMGNAKYRDSDKRLNNPVNDATDVAEKLESLGFTVIPAYDRTRQGMEMAINDFGIKARDYDVALFYYAGHGIRSNGDNYLIPVDANLPDESYVRYNCTNANLVLDLMEKAHCKMKIVILDACRNNPFARSWHRGEVGGGLGSMTAPKGTFIAFSTSPGEVAQDGTGRNSPYTAALLQTLDIPNLSITDFFQEVLEKVASKTQERQTPWTSNSFRGRFVFNQK